VSESTTLTPDPAALTPNTGPGPTVGELAPEASSSSPPPPASLSPEPVAEPVAQSEPVAPPVVEEKRTSILSDAQGELKVDEPAKPETTEEVKAEEIKEEPKAEEPAKEPEPLAPPVYEAFQIPEGVTLAEDKIGTFSGLLGEYENKVITDPAQAHVAFQELGQKMVDFYVAEAKENAERAARLQRETWDRTVEEWQTAFRDDPEIGKNRQDTTLQRAGGLFNLYGQQTSPERETAVRDALGVTGAGNHPEVIRFVNWMASRLTERPRVVTPMLPKAPARQNLSPAQRLYRNSTGAA
jgi:hypothetical protein